tara:strand:+ start:2704 stop:3723 length:1020 start_codon:yes stop_codon:yes gene_type:complete
MWCIEKLYEYFNKKIIKFKLLKSIDYKDYSWVISSEFNYKHPRKSLLNLAYPSAIAYYYVTVVPSNSDYIFYGKMPDKNVFEISLSVYYDNGNLNNNYEILSSYNSSSYVFYNVNNKTNDILYVLQRFYVNMDYYNSEKIKNALFKVFDNNNNKEIPIYPEFRRISASCGMTQPYRKILSFISPKIKNDYTPFFLPGETNSLFPDENHYYLLCLPGDYKLLKLSGNYSFSKIIPYIDFITINQDTTETDNGLPFYKFVENGSYDNIFIASHDVSNKYIYQISKDAKIIRWEDDNTNRGIILRVIDYNVSNVNKTYGPLNPIETKLFMTNDFYPNVIPIL